VAGASGVGVVAPRAADVVRALENDVVVEPRLLQPYRRSDPGESAADDRDVHVLVHDCVQPSQRLRARNLHYCNLLSTMALVRSPRMRAAERRQQLLDTTLDLVVERGFHAVTIEAVAQGAGVTRPIVYKQFTHLSGLVEALIDREEDRAISQLARAIPNIPG